MGVWKKLQWFSWIFGAIRRPLRTMIMGTVPLGRSQSTSRTDSRICSATSNGGTSKNQSRHPTTTNGAQRKVDGGIIKPKGKKRKKISIFFKGPNTPKKSSAAAVLDISPTAEQEKRPEPDWQPRIYKDDVENCFPNTAVSAVYLPARPRKSKRSSELVRRAILAEPEQSISDLSLPPSPPIPSKDYKQSHNRSFSTSREILKLEPKADRILEHFEPFEDYHSVGKPLVSIPDQHFEPAGASIPNLDFDPQLKSISDRHSDQQFEPTFKPISDQHLEPQFRSISDQQFEPSVKSISDQQFEPPVKSIPYRRIGQQSQSTSGQQFESTFGQQLEPTAGSNRGQNIDREIEPRSRLITDHRSDQQFEPILESIPDQPSDQQFEPPFQSIPGRRPEPFQSIPGRRPGPPDLTLGYHTIRTRLGSAFSPIMPSSSELDPMKWAFYNVSAFTMAVCSVFGALAAYFLFYEFVKPAMWAVICGIVLFPLKRHLSGIVKRWLDQLSDTGKPLTFAIAALPLDVTNQMGELLLDTTTNHLKMVLLMVAAFPASALILHFETIPRTLVTAKRLLLLVDNLVACFNGLWVPILLISYLSYICISNIFHHLRSNHLCHISISWTVWSASVAFGCNYFGPFRTPIFLALMAMCCTYYVPFVNAVVSTKKAINRFSRKSTKRGHKSGTREAPEDDVPAKLHNGPHLPEHTVVANESNTYLKRLFIACCFVYVSLHLWIMFILILPVGIALARRIAVKFDIRCVTEKKWRSLKMKLGGDTALLFPEPFLHVFRVLLHIDGRVMYYLRQSMDLVGSMTAMVLLLVSAAAVLGFVTFQLYYESMHLINLTADIANQTLTKNPGLQKWLRNTVHVDSVADLANEIVHRGYGISRNWLAAQMQEIVQDDPEKAKLLESQVVNTLDAFFHNWLSSRNATNSTALAHSAAHRTAISQWADVWSAIGEGGDLDWNLLDNLHEYVSLLLSVADSAWTIVKNNMEVLMIGCSQIISTLLASGTAVVDFFLDSIVFLSFLMYLLSESDDEYKPLKLIRDLVPGGQEMASKITEQVEQAVNGVFLATSKMAVFYGMLTWLTHTLFAVNLVFIPSVLAAAFAAIPFFGTYIVALPAVLELWLIRGEPFLAILLLVIHYIPSYVVDDAIYSDIKLTTPLLSGMAIAGGMLWWGLEGAIFGPLVLCGILVLGGVYKSIFFKTMTSTTGPVSSNGESVSSDETVVVKGPIASAGDSGVECKEHG